MKIYIDIIILINFFFDFLLLFFTTIFLKNKLNIKKLLIASFFGAISILVLFLNLNNFTLFIIKLFISVIMIIINFGFNGLLKNIFTLYFISIFLGGFLYLINNMFTYKVDGLLFINNEYSINIILIIIFTPVILYIFIKEYKNNNQLNNIYNVKIKYLNNIYHYKGYLDTGNNLYDPYFHKPICVLYDNKLKLDKTFIITYNTLSETGILNCIKAEELIIKDKIYNNVYIGISRKKFILNNCEMIIHKDYL